MNISHEAIYLYIYLHCKSELKKELIAQLRQERKSRWNFKTRAVLEPKIKDRVPSTKDPKSLKGNPRHWEGDLIIGKDHKSCIGTLVERSTRAIIIVPLKQERSHVREKPLKKNSWKSPKPCVKPLPTTMEQKWANINSSPKTPR